MKGINWTFMAGLLLAAISLIFSGTGLVHLFAGAGIAIMVMAVAFEAAKVTITIWLLRNFRWRFLPLALVVCLLALTSVSTVGIYGYLGKAYNTGRKDAVVATGNTENLQSQITSLEADKDRLYKQIEAIPANQGTNRRRILATVQPRIDKIDARLVPLRDSLSKLSATSTAKEQDIGELRYAADLFGMSQEELARLVITILAFLLDPLAVLLIQASGVKTEKRKLSKPAALAAPYDRSISHDDPRHPYYQNPGDPTRPCDRPPEGWYCSRGYGHDGPCPARPLLHPSAVDGAGNPLMPNDHRLRDDAFGAIPLEPEPTELDLDGDGLPDVIRDFGSYAVPVRTPEQIQDEETFAIATPEAAQEMMEAIVQAAGEQPNLTLVNATRNMALDRPTSPALAKVVRRAKRTTPTTVANGEGVPVHPTIE